MTYLFSGVCSSPSPPRHPFSTSPSLYNHSSSFNVALTKAFNSRLYTWVSQQTMADSHNFLTASTALYAKIWVTLVLDGALVITKALCGYL
ncbi:hypothetical protein B0H67DRAFT_53603 [Lasiosphaeris hirsuta]|uniref:Uncharacterized protein n=1 Tax=Lasiosphaeris hirsuta TaxID=260670 RepID=A0AA40BAU9_9PEZI|nr:hypothetical protein B0H67DRAFT_53603 [Lasiosphaeris hirsuta]